MEQSKELETALTEYKRVLATLFSTSKRLDTHCPAIREAIIKAGIEACDNELKKLQK